MRAPLLKVLLARVEDANDPNLPLMYWYAAEPVVAADSNRLFNSWSPARFPSSANSSPAEWP